MAQPIVNLMILNAYRQIPVTKYEKPHDQVSMAEFEQAKATLEAKRMFHVTLAHGPTASTLTCKVRPEILLSFGSNMF